MRPYRFLRHVCYVLLLGIVGLSLSGCFAYNVRQYQPVALDERSMTVPPGGKGLLGAIKDGLREAGWRLTVDRGPLVTQATGTTLQTGQTMRTRYRLVVSDRWYDWCLVGGSAYAYDISVIDNDTGDEVLTLDGNGCERVIVDRLMQALQGKQT